MPMLMTMPILEISLSELLSKHNFKQLKYKHFSYQNQRPLHLWP